MPVSSHQTYDRYIHMIPRLMRYKPSGDSIQLRMEASRPRRPSNSPTLLSKKCEGLQVSTTRLPDPGN